MMSANHDPPTNSKSSQEPPLLHMQGIGKRFPGVQALHDVHLHVQAGQVLALAGENGAGKSTLMKILGGVHTPDEGIITWQGRPIWLSSVAEAQQQGIALIHQELLLADNLDVAGNILLGHEPTWAGPLKLRHRREQFQRCEELLQRVGLACSPRTPLRHLTPGQQQLVEIARALSRDAKLLIMDEPTSSLTLAEIERLFLIIADLKKRGLGIIYISHRLTEINTIADKVEILRDGKNAGSLPGDADPTQIANAMVGRPITQVFPQRTHQPGPIVLSVNNLRVPGTRQGVSFHVHQGEILGLAGLVGSGRTELLHALAGVDPALSGTLTLNGQTFAPTHTRDAIGAGVYLVPEDRKQHGLILSQSMRHNLSLPSLKSIAHPLFMNWKREKELAHQQIEQRHIKPARPHHRVENLSGGNQQKVVLGKWLALSPKVLLLDEPTRGVDVGAKMEIYHEMARLAQAGLAIIMASSDMEEILGLADRTLVLHERQVVGNIARPDFSEEKLIHCMTGQQTQAVGA